MKKREICALLAACGLAAPALAQQNESDIIVTEIMYNPSGAEAETEWVEIYNRGDVPVNISNYRIDDEDLSSPSNPFGAGAIRLPDGMVLRDPMSPIGAATGDTATIIPDVGDENCGALINCDGLNELIIMPGEAIIIASFWDDRSDGFSSAIDRYPNNSFEGFIGSFGEDTDGDGFGDTVDYKIVMLISSITIANTGTAVNEVFDLLDGFNSVDFVNYQAGNGSNFWPFSTNGRSISLKPEFVLPESFNLPNGQVITGDFARSLGSTWELSQTGINGAVDGRQVERSNNPGNPFDTDESALVTLFSASDQASPGVVALSDTRGPRDLNSNGRSDVTDIFFGNLSQTFAGLVFPGGVSLDTNANGIPDETEGDCNNNGIPDASDGVFASESDLDVDGTPDTCQITGNPMLDMNANGILDEVEGVAPNIIITEIHFDAAGDEGQAEYIELYNAGNTAESIEGFFFQDLDLPSPDGPSASFPAVTVPPAGIVVVGEMPVDIYTQAWGGAIVAGTEVLNDAMELVAAGIDSDDDGTADYQYIDLASDIGTANNADLVNENRTLRTPFITETVVDDMTMEETEVITGGGFVVDVANHQGTTSNGVSQGGWPANDGRGSFYLLGQALNGTVDFSSNNNPANWATSIAGIDFARNANFTDNGNDDISDRNAGTPGFINFGAPVGAPGDVVISEIFFATNSEFPRDFSAFPDAVGALAPTGIDEWVEITNVSGQTLDIGGWYLEDEDGRTQGLPSTASLAPGETAVIIPNDFPGDNPDPVTEFYAAWGGGYQVFAVDNFSNYSGDGLDRLGDLGENGVDPDNPFDLNNPLPPSPSFLAPSGGRELLSIKTDDGVLQDLVNYDDDGFIWPLGTATDTLASQIAFSIYVFDSALNEADNDNGLNWLDSFAGFDGARANNITTVYNADQEASPGLVDGFNGPLDLNNFISPDPCFGSADVDYDFDVDVFDLIAFLENFQTGNCGGNPACLVADVNGDGMIDVFDLIDFLTGFSNGCGR